jgi:hypothetical protein
VWITYSTYGYAFRNNISTPINIYAQINKHLLKDAEIAFVGFAEQFALFSPYPIVHFGYHTPYRYQVLAAWQWQSSNKQFVLIDKGSINANC